MKRVRDAGFAADRLGSSDRVARARRQRRAARGKGLLASLRALLRPLRRIGYTLADAIEARLRRGVVRAPARLPSAELPSDRIPSDRIPSDRIPSVRIPSLRIPSMRWPALRLPSVRLPSWFKRGRRRASRTGRAGLAAIATCRWLHTKMQSCAGPPPAVGGEGGHVALAARCVQVP